MQWWLTIAPIRICFNPNCPTSCSVSVLGPFFLLFPLWETCPLNFGSISELVLNLWVGWRGGGVLEHITFIHFLGIHMSVLSPGQIILRNKSSVFSSFWSLSSINIVYVNENNMLNSGRKNVFGWLCGQSKRLLFICPLLLLWMLAFIRRHFLTTKISNIDCKLSFQ